jgi:hypothetical protein
MTKPASPIEFGFSKLIECDSGGDLSEIIDAGQFSFPSMKHLQVPDQERDE